MYYEHITNGRKSGGRPRRDEKANTLEDGRNLE
jgi:hypothetical protein